jgi:hypothetical protein
MCALAAAIASDDDDALSCCCCSTAVLYSIDALKVLARPLASKQYECALNTAARGTLKASMQCSVCSAKPPQ